MARPKPDRYECRLHVDPDGGVTRRYVSCTGEQVRGISQQAYSAARGTGAICGLVVVVPEEIPVVRAGQENQVVAPPAAGTSAIPAPRPTVPDPLAASEEVRGWLDDQYELPDAMTTAPDYLDSLRAVNGRIASILRHVMWPVFDEDGQVLADVVTEGLRDGGRSFIEGLLTQSIRRRDVWPTFLALTTQGTIQLKGLGERLQTLSKADPYDVREAGMVEDDIVRAARPGERFFETMLRWRRRDRYEIEEEPRWQAFGDLAEEIHHIRNALRNLLEPEVRFRLMAEIGAEADRLADQARAEADRRRPPMTVAASWFRPRSKKRLTGNQEYLRLLAFAVAIRLAADQQQ